MLQTLMGYNCFKTALGVCAIAWNDRGVTGVWLPEASTDRLRARLAARFGRSAAVQPPPSVQAAIDGIVRLLAGERRDLRDVLLDTSAIPDFNRQVYDVARRIAPGATMTYGEVAAALGDPGAARAVGQALGRNPFPIVVPCHRVVGAGGRLVGFSAPGGTATKQRLLAIEGAAAAALPLLDLAEAR
jgi:methylated-DNA-[protein]-cysteine S-methyltransferase